jgi:hypothetical protein
LPEGLAFHHASVERLYFFYLGLGGHGRVGEANDIDKEKVGMYQREVVVGGQAQMAAGASRDVSDKVIPEVLFSAA